MQDELLVDGSSIRGSLLPLTTGQLVTAWGPGHFMALKFDIDPTADSVRVGMMPSYKTGTPDYSDANLVEIKDDPDKNGAFKVTNTDQKFKIISTKGNQTKVQLFDLSDLELV